jgi:hypothetical protein
VWSKSNTATTIPILATKEVLSSHDSPGTFIAVIDSCLSTVVVYTSECVRFIGTGQLGLDSSYIWSMYNSEVAAVDYCTRNHIPAILLVRKTTLGPRESEEKAAIPWSCSTGTVFKSGYGKPPLLS